ncbi:hypothetical protein GC207_10585 [bacterium]|nr:hypothetical protein [bacterium]
MIDKFSKLSGGARTIVLCAAILLIATSVARSATATRTVTTTAGLVTVELAIQPDAGAKAFCVEEQLPPNAAARAISSGGAFDANRGKVKWGPFLDDQARTLNYQIISTDSQTATILGTASFDGTSNVTTTGTTTAALEPSGLDSWLLASWGADIFDRPERLPDSNVDGDDFPIAVEFYFNLRPDEVDAHPIQLMRDEGSGEVAVIFDRQKNPDGYQLELSHSTDLSAWFSFDGLLPAVQDIGSGLEHVEYRLPAGEDVRFVRASLEQLP